MQYILCMGEPPWLSLNQRDAQFSFYYTKRSSITYAFKQLALNPQALLTRTKSSVVVCVATMTGGSSASQYALGSTDAEHERLMRQAVCLAPLTERLLREAGIASCRRVLDVGSGV